jgi:AcrR family transcriptional regulator
VRRNELMDVAERLFAEKGYDHTSPSDIARRAGVVRGTFYHYFRSRDDLIRAIISRHFDRNLQYNRDVIADPALDATDKLRRIVDSFLNISAQKAQLGMLTSEEPEVSNHRDYDAYMREHILPLLQQVIRQGVDEGAFKVTFPEETAGYLIAISRHFQDELKGEADPEARARKIEAVLVAMEALLGVPPGTFSSRP